MLFRSLAESELLRTKSLKVSKDACGRIRFEFAVDGNWTSGISVYNWWRYAQQYTRPTSCALLIRWLILHSDLTARIFFTAVAIQIGKTLQSISSLFVIASILFFLVMKKLSIIVDSWLDPVKTIGRSS